MAISTTYRTKSKVRQNRPLEDFYAEKKRKERRFSQLSVGREKRYLSAFWLFLSIGLFLVLGISVATYYIQNRKVQSLNINVEASAEGYFINEEDVRGILVSEKHPLLEERLKDIQLSELEEELKANPFVKEAEIYKSLNGALNVWLNTRVPIARIVNNSGEKIYVDENGMKFPSSERFAAHVPLIRGDFQEIIFPQDSFDCRIIEAALPLLTFIHQDPFWSQQISEIFIEEDGDLILYPQVGDVYVDFGQPVRIEEKFSNLHLFYKEVLNKVGWDSYDGVSVKYRQQVIGIK